MRSEQYQTLRQQYHRLASLPPAERERELQRLIEDGTATPELERLFEPEPSDGLLLDGGERFLEGLALATNRDVGSGSWPDFDWVPPDRVGDFKVLACIGRGGSGVVYRGQQERPRREVAIKLLPPLVDAPQARLRFEFEAQVLADLDHPNIAQVLQAGVDPSGSPYIVIEYVDGEGLLEHCRQEGLNPLQRLQLFERVLEGVEHAHRRGVIHRDLKPENILVDGDGRPRLIDFGIARSAEESRDLSASPDGRGLLGSIPWMSPEQARGEHRHLDTRSDVYSLGVLLFRLLTGEMPHGGSEAPASETTDPETGEALVARIAHGPARRMRHVDRGIHRDLEAIVARCLAPQAESRYASAAELKVDLRRHLEGQPVDARPATAVYVLSKLAAKHRALVGVSALLLLSLIAGLLASLSLWHEAEEARRTAQEESRVAQAEAETNFRITNFLVQMFDAATPSSGGAREVSALDVVNAAQEQMRQSLATDRDILNPMLVVLGRVYYQLGETDVALELLDEALSYLEQAKERHPVHYSGAVYIRALTEMERGNYAAAALDLESVMIETRELLGPEHPQVREMLRGYSGVLAQLGRLDEAEEILLGELNGHSEAYPEEELTRLSLVSNLGVVYMTRGQWESAEPLVEEARAGYQRLLGTDHIDTIGANNSVAQVLAGRGEYERALHLAEEVVEGMRAVLPDGHPQVDLAVLNLGSLFARMERWDDAAVQLQLAIDGLEQSLSHEHPHTLGAMTLLAQIYQEQGRTQEGRELYETALEAQERTLGPEARQSIYTLIALATLDEDDPEAALPRLRLATERAERGCEAGDPIRFQAHLRLGLALWDLEDYASAASQLGPLLAGTEELEREAGDELLRRLSNTQPSEDARPAALTLLQGLLDTAHEGGSREADWSPLLESWRSPD
jgi:serine/threonine protein kinase